MTPDYEYKGKCHIRFFNCDNMEALKNIESRTIDVILTDPPYLYLKNQKLDREFDEITFFNECRRVLTKDGFIVMFGRGSSFYRWNTILNDLGFVFKEEIVWDKGYCTSPLMSMSRVHETVSIHTKGKGCINKIKVPYLEMKSHDIESIIKDIKRLKVTFKNTKSLDAVMQYLENNTNSDIGTSRRKHNYKNNIVASDGLINQDRQKAVMSAICDGMNEKSVIRTDMESCSKFTKYGITADERLTGDRCVNVANSIVQGMNEKSVIKEVGNRHKTIHPTQKPVKLLERLLALVVPKYKQAKEITILDPFGGSFSSMVAASNMGLNGIACEIDKEYFDKGVLAFKQHVSQQKLF